jgi:hypothetical protein
MKTSQSLALVSTVAVVLALTACGGGGGDAVVTTPTAPTTPTTPVPPAAVSISVAGIFKYMADLMGLTSDISAPNDITTTELAVDETSEPASI